MLFFAELVGISICVYYTIDEAGPMTACLLGYFTVRSVGMVIRISKICDMLEKLSDEICATRIRGD